MLVCMKVEVSGTRAGRDWPARGQTIELPDGEAAELCQAGLAVPAVEDTTKTATAPDDAEVRRSRTRKASHGGAGVDPNDEK